MSPAERHGPAGRGLRDATGDAPGLEEKSEAGTARRGRRRRGAETLMVPEAEFTSYYGLQIIHTPAWEVPDVPAYLYLGGMAGAAAAMGVAGDLTGNGHLRRTGRLTASAASVLSVGFLVHDLGRPSRFLNMLRVFKVTSPLSMGTWILSPFATFAGAAAVAELRGVLLPVLERVAGARVAGLAAAIAPAVGRASGLGAGLFGPALSTYTAVLIADTAVPSWHAAYPELPFVFAGSGMASAGGIGMIASPVADAAPARRMALLGAGLELAATQRMEHRIGLVAEPFQKGRPGLLLKLAQGSMAVGSVGALVAGRLGRRGRGASVVAGVLLNLGAALTRFGIYDAGVESAKDPKYTVIPQRERLDAKRAAKARAAEEAAAAGPAAATGA